MIMSVCLLGSSAAWSCRPLNRKVLQMYKSQLQEFAQKAGLPAPIYEMNREGPSHEPHFKASVIIQGNTYESPASFGSLKKAEHAAAEVALAALGKSETGPLHESGLCKNLLQEYAQKCKLPLPVYSSVKTGETPQSLSFVATVEVGGVEYQGEMCKTKKEAEIKAAKTALVAIYADSDASFPQTAEDEKAASEPEDSPAAEVTTPSEPKVGGKRKKLFKGGKEVRKQKVEESGNGEAKQVNGLSSSPATGTLKAALPVQ